MWTTALIVFLSLVGLIILGVFIIPLFLPKSYEIEKSIVVNAPPEHCFGKVADLRAYRDWNPWSRAEPEAMQTFTGAPKTVGHSYSWSGARIGQGSLTVKKLDAPRAAELELAFIKPFRSVAADLWRFEADGAGTRVTWTNAGSLSYPVARLMGPFIAKNLNKQFEQGLVSLKELCEKTASKE